MNRCPSCDYPLPTDRERLAARCPKCFDPLYEPPGRASRAAREGEGVCALHPGRETVGACGRCGNYFCEVCRTRWRDQMLCAACVERALASREATPEQLRVHFRQALLGLLMGIAAWGLFLLGQVLLVGALLADRNLLLVLLALVLVVSSVMLAVTATGQAAAAVRTRGQHMIMAVSGLSVSALFLGAFIGNYLFQLWIL
jgi:hypothetical protein